MAVVEARAVSDFWEIMFTRTWWRYSPGDGQWFTLLYHWFNIAEGVAWVVFAGLVLRRYLRNRRSSLELWYCFAFFIFALTDFREAWAQSSGLIWFKLLNLIGLFLLRRAVLSRHYPDAKLY